MNDDALMDLARCIERGHAATIEAGKIADPALLQDLRQLEAVWNSMAATVRAASRYQVQSSPEKKAPLCDIEENSLVLTGGTRR
jgi:hypothetical protein